MPGELDSDASDDTISDVENEGDSQEAPLSDTEAECWYCSQCDMQVWDPTYPVNGVTRTPYFARVCLGCNQSFRFCDVCFNTRNWTCWTCEVSKYSQDSD